jgi:hypothetical protein
MAHLPDRYGIINISDLSQIDFSQISESSSDTIRKSLDESLFVIKWDSEHEPTFITDGSVVPVQTLSHSDCLILMSSAEWTEPEPVE